MKVMDQQGRKHLFVADLHFRHKNIIPYTQRGIDTTVEEHDEWLIDLWNKQVGKNDIVWHMGDFVFNCRKLDVFKSITDRLNGKIILLRGNHDDRDTFNKSGFEWYDLKHISFKRSSEDKGQYATLCHYPMAVWDKSAHGSWMICGHSHGSYTPEKGKILDVGLDSAYNILGEHRFFTIEDLYNYMATREISFNDHHGTHTKE